VLVTRSPNASEAAQNVVVGHDTASSRPFASTLLGADHVVAPPAGSLDVITFPLLSTATHNDMDGHDTLASWFGRSTGATVHADASPVGSVDVSRFPFPSTPTQS
jgi:hypothetical protein